MTNLEKLELRSEIIKQQIEFERVKIANKNKEKMNEVLDCSDAEGLVWLLFKLRFELQGDLEYIMTPEKIPNSFHRMNEIISKLYQIIK